MNYNDETYWNNEIINDFADRDELDDKNYFVISYLAPQLPYETAIHCLMNFKSYQKMCCYIKYFVLRQAICDAFNFDFNTSVNNRLEIIVSEYKKSNVLSDEQSKLMSLWDEIDRIAFDDKQNLTQLADFKSRFESICKSTSDYIHGFEIIAPDDSLPDFWREFFMLDEEDDNDVDELKMLENALESYNTDLLDDLISYHC